MNVREYIELPDNVISAITLLENAGYEAYAVGGSVRDSFLGNLASDFDITTSALPVEIKKVFERFKIIETGIKHGTVTVLFDVEPLEITTYRVDGEYEDNRHPKNVVFTRNIKEDLSRRDFTVNAIAFNHKRGIVDPFGGINDLKCGIIRAVGDAEKRFNEDALRILRCVRFSSVLGFEIEKDTKDSVKKMVHLLKNVSSERIFSELKKLICGKNVGSVMAEFPMVITHIIPELSLSVGFDQKSKYHVHDVYTHTYKSIEAADNDVIIRLALLFHDCGKPYVCTEDEHGFRHFVGHQKKSEELANESLLRLKCDNKTLTTVKKLVLFHDYRLIPEKKYIRRFLTNVSFEEARQIIKIKYADMSTHAPQYRLSKAEIEKYLCLVDEIEKTGECITLKSLAINGEDLLNIGVTKGKKVGEILNDLLSAVISDELPNEKEILLSKAKSFLQ